MPCTYTGLSKVKSGELVLELLALPLMNKFMRVSYAVDLGVKVKTLDEVLYWRYVVSPPTSS